MYYGAIYARCANGYDLEKRCEEHNSGGYKVHGISRELLNDDSIDTNYLVKILERTIPVNKETLLDDGFFYSAGDTGSRFLTRFHYVTEAFRNFFISQAYIGKYENFYPFELFSRNELWDAKDKTEEHYLTAPTAYLPAVAALEDPSAPTILQEAVRFIENGRKAVFKQALAFLISQYTLEKSQRKYLVIRDRSEKEIEYWIAALSSAVSPRMAAELTFATRMESIQNTNRYAVDSSGRYQKEMDFQKAPNSLRRIAMIVGAVDADRDNADIAVRSNSPYVILNGATKNLSETVDDSDPYYEFAASLSDESFFFCRNFVQAFGYTAPSGEITALYREYRTLAGNDTGAEFAASLKAVLSRPIAQKEKLRWLYAKTKKIVQEGRRQDPETLIVLASGMRQLSKQFGCSEEAEIEDEVLDAFEDVIFTGVNKERKLWWSLLRRSEFALGAAQRIMDPETFRQHETAFEGMSATDATMVASIFLDMHSITAPKDAALAKKLCAKVIHTCRDSNNTSAAKEVVASVERIYGKNASEIWNGILKKNDSDSNYLLDLLYPDDGSFPEDLSKFLMSCSQLCKNGETAHAEKLILRTIKGAKTADQIESLMNRLQKEPFFASINKDAYYKLIDARVGFHMKDNRLPLRIQKEKPAKTKCVNSAHIAALAKLGSMRRNDIVEDALGPYFEQGFPSRDDSNYVSALCNAILQARLSDSDAAYLMKRLLESETESYYRMLVTALYERAARKTDLWNTAIRVAALSRKQNVRDRAFNTLVSVLLKQKDSQSAMEKAGKYLNGEAAMKFYSEAVDIVLRKRAEAKPKLGGLFKSLFGKTSGK